jgi:L-threonylcarbamoyladenylate synthase
VLRGLADRIDLLLDAGPTPGGIESTVIDLCGDIPRLLRPGLVTPVEVEAIVGPIARAPTTPDGVPRSPGMLSRHYAPRAVLECVAGDGFERAAEFAAGGERVALLALGESGRAEPENVTVVAMPANPIGYSARLYAVLYELDAAETERIVVALPPDDDAWLAVRDRLMRAAARP